MYIIYIYIKYTYIYNIYICVCVYLICEITTHKFTKTLFCYCQFHIWQFQTMKDGMSQKKDSRKLEVTKDFSKLCLLCYHLTNEHISTMHLYYLYLTN